MLNSPTIVDAAFTRLLAALDAEVAELEKIGGEVFHDCSPKQARGLLRTAKDTAGLKEHIVHLYSEWKSGGPIQLGKPPPLKSPRSKQEPLNPVLIRHMKGVSITDVAISLGVKVAKVREWLERGTLKGYRPTNGRRKVTLPDLRAFISQHPELLKK